VRSATGMLRRRRSRVGAEPSLPSIGLILCKDRNKVVVEYALRGSAQPIGVAEYQLTKRLPEEFRGSLPTPEELRRGLK